MPRRGAARPAARAHEEVRAALRMTTSLSIKRAFKEAGVEPGDLKTLEDITKFPFVVKQDMRDDYPYGLFAVPRARTWRVMHASSGTTGQATVVGCIPQTISRTGATASRAAMPYGDRRRELHHPGRPTATACSPAAWARIRRRGSRLRGHPHLLGQHRSARSR